MKLPRVSPWFWAAWILVGFGLEMQAVFNGYRNDSLTQTILHYVPAAVVVGALAWIVWHFTTRILRGRRDGL